jgi:hypothetical protein
MEWRDLTPRSAITGLRLTLLETERVAALLLVPVELSRHPFRPTDGRPLLHRQLELLEEMGLVLRTMEVLLQIFSYLRLVAVVEMEPEEALSGTAVAVVRGQQPPIPALSLRLQEVLVGSARRLLRLLLEQAVFP